MSTIFSIANTVAMIAWLFLIIFPNWKGTQKVVRTGGVSLLFAAAYIIIIGMSLASASDGGTPMDFTSLEGVMALFRDETAVTAGWLHYLAFDLFVGVWEVNDAKKWGLPHGYVIPCLLLTFMFGPVGLLLYMGIRKLIVNV